MRRIVIRTYSWFNFLYQCHPDDERLAHFLWQTRLSTNGVTLVVCLAAAYLAGCSLARPPNIPVWWRRVCPEAQPFSDLEC